MNKKLYFNSEIDLQSSDYSKFKQQMNNTHYNQLKRLEKKMSQKGQQAHKYLISMKKSSSSITETKKRVYQKPNQKQQLDNLCQKLQNHINKLMAYYMECVRQIEQLYGYTQKQMEAVYSQILQQPDCCYLRLKQCVQITESCMKILEKNTNFTKMKI